ncbi:MAG: hypothetical protein KF850_28430 [Labilithrix sp.]|nr:hypothetical protein [Labilithrix sp.]MBX3216000.1 hypothetical protein [Labilithrix sp.]
MPELKLLVSSRAPDRKRVSTAPRRLSLLFRGLAILIPTSVLVVAVRAPASELAHALGVAAPPEIGLLTRVLVVALAVAPAIATALSLESLRRCALSIHEGRGLTLDVARRLRSAATWMFVASAAALVVPTLATMLLSAASGRLTVAVHVGSGVVLPIVLAGALRLLGSVVVEAAALADDHAQIV